MPGDRADAPPPSGSAEPPLGWAGAAAVVVVVVVVVAPGVGGARVTAGTGGSEAEGVAAVDVGAAAVGADGVCAWATRADAMWPRAMVTLKAMSQSERIFMLKITPNLTTYPSRKAGFYYDMMTLTT